MEIFEDFLLPIDGFISNCDHPKNDEFSPSGAQVIDDWHRIIGELLAQDY